MNFQLLKRYQRINEAAAVNLHIEDDGQIQVHLCSVILSGNRLDIDKKVAGLTSLELIGKHLPAGLPVVLNITGKGVLHKKINRTEEIGMDSFSALLPNAKIEDFYIQNFPSGTVSFVSVIRRTEADKWISELKALKLLPLMLSLGPFPVSVIIPQLNVYEGKINIHGHVIERNEKKEWTGYHFGEQLPSQFPFKIASEKIDERLIIPFAASFQLALANSVEAVYADVEPLKDALREKLVNNKIRVQGFLILMVFFFLLLINFFLLSSLNDANSNLDQQLRRFARSNSNSAGISEQVRKNTALLRDLGWDGGINKSKLIDELAGLMPQEVSLIKAAINPVDIATSRVQKSLTFYDRRISITGRSAKITSVNEWIARLKTRPWVKNIQMESYSFNTEENTGRFVITLAY